MSNRNKDTDTKLAVTLMAAAVAAILRAAEFAWFGASGKASNFEFAAFEFTEFEFIAIDLRRRADCLACGEGAAR